MKLTRRSVLTGLLAGGASPVLANAPTRSIRPWPRGAEVYPRSIPGADALIAEAGLGGEVCFAVADARTGQVLEARGPDLALPPASTAKAMTALYGLDKLGPAYRFRTHLRATGPVVNGQIRGDLVLCGGGDPTLDTDALASMVDDLKAAGVREVRGVLRVWDGRLPRLARIDPEQPAHVGYNPALSGLNLNFNRVHFGWKRRGSDYEVVMDAPSARHRPAVTIARMRVVDRRGPIYTYSDADEYDDWTVARGALGNGGSRWLPVRRPALYAGEVFKVLAREKGLMIGGDIERADGPSGEELVGHHSAPLHDILRGMLKYSTNVTAELVGLSASTTDEETPTDLEDSAARMNVWLGREMTETIPAFEDHSGLSDDSRISANTMLTALVRVGPEGSLRPLLKPFPVDTLPDNAVRAKTGTLNFVNALAGYLKARDGSDLAFTILCADVPRRDALTLAQRERPPGGRSYIYRARTLQRALLNRWASVYSA